MLRNCPYLFLGIDLLVFDSLGFDSAAVKLPPTRLQIPVSEIPTLWGNK